MKWYNLTDHIQSVHVEGINENEDVIYTKTPQPLSYIVARFLLKATEESKKRPRKHLRKMILRMPQLLDRKQRLLLMLLMKRLIGLNEMKMEKRNAKSSIKQRKKSFQQVVKIKLPEEYLLKDLRIKSQLSKLLREKMIQM